MVKETSVRKRRCTSHAYTSTAGLSFLYTTRGSGKGWCKQSGCLCIGLILIACSRVKASHVCRGIGGTIVLIRITNETLFFRCDMKSTGVERARRTMKTGPLGSLARWPACYGWHSLLFLVYRTYYYIRSSVRAHGRHMQRRGSGARGHERHRQTAGSNKRNKSREIWPVFSVKQNSARIRRVAAKKIYRISDFWKYEVTRIRAGPVVFVSYYIRYVCDGTGSSSFVRSLQLDVWLFYFFFIFFWILYSSWFAGVLRTHSVVYYCD